MDEKGFREYLKDTGKVRVAADDETIDSYVRLAREFEAFLGSQCSGERSRDAGEAAVRAFVERLAEDDRNTFDNMVGLIRYARFVGNPDAEVSILLMLDGVDVLKTLCGTFRAEYGDERFEEVLGGFEPPAIGTHPGRMPDLTAEFLGRLEEGVGEEATRELLLTGPHAAPPEYHVKEREMFLASKDVDEYLRKRHEAFVNELQGHMDRGTLFFTQGIDQGVMDFVKGDPEISSGVRIGDRIFVTKIPFMAIEYLREKNERMRRYYGCHCLLARESVLSGREMSRNLCYCSAGFDKRPFEVAFDRPLKAEVERSILWGDTTCRFSIEVPEEFLPEKG